MPANQTIKAAILYAAVQQGQCKQSVAHVEVECTVA